ncbi:MAG: RluA family pseudouridine synthase [Chitinivibrionales bacterium]|nr:RluA family pseudouridine synthase [Chitinivibrionales bacterium]
MIFKSEVPSHLAQHTLIDYLAERFTYHPREQWLIHIRENRILLNDKPAAPGTTVMRGDIVTYKPLPFSEPEANLNYQIVYEDEWYIGVNKPPNLLVHRAGKAFTKNLVYQLRIRKKEYKDVSVINRLDRNTSGVVVAAKSSDAAVKLGKMFHIRNIKKEYFALVHSSPHTVPYTIDLPIAKNVECTKYPRYHIDLDNGKSSKTEIITMQRIGNSHSLLTVIPYTGRTHQIRVHLQSIDCPLVGDHVYGTESPEESDKWIQRQALHCTRITFDHPFTREPCVIEAELPEDMERLIRILGKK